MQDTTENLTIDVGLPGENRVWDFSNLDLHGNEYAIEFISPVGTPFTGIFPTANFSIRERFYDGDSGITSYNYWQVTPSNIFFLGVGIQDVNSGETYTEADDDTTALPLSYGMQWTNAGNY